MMGEIIVLAEIGGFSFPSIICNSSSNASPHRLTKYFIEHYGIHHCFLIPYFTKKNKKPTLLYRVDGKAVRYFLRISHLFYIPRQEKQLVFKLVGCTVEG